MSFIAAALLFAAAAQAAPDDVKINQLIVYGNDACPQSTPDEIIVCARLDEEERFRIPNQLRGNPADPRNDSWANRAIELSYVGREGIGSCSPVGPGGASGCYADLVRRARAERQGRDEINWNRMIEEARQERLGRIDEEAEAVERAIRDER
ncbi:MAG: hypothetical protein ACK4K7_04355 [Allosphingosinicella sp.]|uniref:hypothetical protein n=1 Tax=Allosphingosinicella sp. TaxID=2823234 RepID=UPI003925A529